MICSNCGVENPEERDFCQSCGAPLAESFPGPTSPSSPSPIHAAPAAPATSGLAIASLIIGIVGWFLLPIVGNVLAIIFGHMAKNEIARSGGHLTGEALATVGLILGYIGVGVWALSILAFMVFGVGMCGCGMCTSLLAAIAESGTHY
ncbi:MAG: DUF4190 domain-containing protein [Chloroflexota bacterium]|nr:DUF4190 domain-containing protein [Chloroflexota bacterium]